MKKSTKILLLFTLLAFNACKKDDDTTPTTDYTDQSVASVEATAMYASLYDVVVAVDDAMDGSLDGLPNGRIDATCGSISLDKTNKSLVIDYGSGCSSRTGVQKKGKITIKYDGDTKTGSGQSWVMTFDGYSIESYSLGGTVSVMYAYKKDLNSYQATISSTGFTCSNGTKTVTLSSMNLTTLINLGTKLKDLTDNEAKLSGTLAGKNSDGKSFATETTSDLVFKGACTEAKYYVPSSGILKVTVSGVSATVDFSAGTGDCNNTIKITYPNGSSETKDL